MPRSADEVRDIVVRELVPQHHRERRRLDLIAAAMRGQAGGIYVPRSATAEYRRLVEQSSMNVLPIVVMSIAQNLYAEGYRSSQVSTEAGDAQNARVWDQAWQPNRMDARQAGMYRAALTYGYAYAVALPGVLASEPAAVIRPYSPRKLTAVYADPVEDEWPEYAIITRRPLADPAAPGSDPLATPTIANGTRITFVDESAVYELVKRDAGWIVDDEAYEHGLGICPVVRYLNHLGELDDPTPEGEIEALIPAQRQLNQTTFSLLMAQQYAAFRQRWVTGMKIDKDEDGNPLEPLNPSVSRMFQAENPDTRFGEFQQTDLSGYLTARDKLLMYVSSFAQVPPHNLLAGTGISNLSAEALAALQSGLDRKVAERKMSFGESDEQLLRLCGLAMGDRETWEDTAAKIVWRDTTPRSLGQISDYLVKLSTIGMPIQALIEMIPGDEHDHRRWLAMIEEADLLSRLETMVEPDSDPDPVADAEPASPTRD